MRFRISDFGFRIGHDQGRADRGVHPCLPIALAVAMALALPGLARADEQADRQFTFAARLMQRSELQLAQEAFGEFIRKNPGDARVDDARYYIGLLAYRQRDAATALKELGSITKPKDVSMAATLLLRGQIKLATGDGPGAVSDLEKVDGTSLTDNETKASWHYLLGGAYRTVKNTTAAAKQFDMASEADSKVRGLALLELGKVRIESGDTAAALEALTAAIDAQLDAPQAAEARGLAAAVAYEQRQYEMSAHLYNQIIQRYQTTEQFKPALMGLLRALYASGQDEELIRQHEALAKLLSPDEQAEALYLRGAAHVRLKQYDEGGRKLLDFFQRFGKDHPLSDEVAYLFAVCFYHSDLDRFEKWYAGLEGELDKMAHGPDLRYLRAQAAIKREQFAQAIAYLDPLIAKPENDYAQRALLQRAALYEKLDNKAKASSDYALYVTRYGKDPKSVDAGRWAIDLAFNAGEYEKVAELAPTWAAAQKDAPATAPVRIKQIIALIKLKRNDEALKAADTLLGIEKADPKLVTLGHFYRGLILASKAQPVRDSGVDSTKPAIEALQAALSGALPETQQAEAIELIARLHRMAGRDDDAIAMYETLRQRRPLDGVNTLTALWVGRGLHHRKRYETALIWLTEVLGRRDAEPSAMAEALFLAAESNHDLDKHAEALKLYDQLLAFGHAFGDQARLGRAQSLAALDRTDEAIKQYDDLITVDASMIAATALLEGGLLHWRRARLLEKANDTPAADEAYAEARKRLNRTVILYDLPQLGTLPDRAMVMLGVVDAASGKVDKQQVRERLDAVLKRPTPTAWQSAAKAEIALLDGRRGEAVFLWRKMITDSDEPAAKAYARGRLADLGETP
ncbi:MAG: tetratricopeptide repeat protein [Phycisphaera sp.]|nr:tetratricopeptide repeat protein [Phycisphaera sp.]